MATGTEGYLLLKISEGHRDFMVVNDFWANVAREIGRIYGKRIYAEIGPETKSLD